MTRKPLLGVFFALAATTLVACSTQAPPDHQHKSRSPAETATASPTTDPAVPCPPLPLNVAISYTLTSDSTGGVVVKVITNLPETTNLQASFYSPSTRFLAQDPKKVSNGEASFGPFADHGSPLHGAYDFSVTAPIARNQPPAVQRCIGKAGENLTGPLVKREEITGDNYASVDAPVVFP